MASLGERIRQLREENEMTGEQLGKLLNVSKQSISKWEKNISNPDIETIKRLAKIFNTTVDFISGSSDIKNPYEAHERISDSIEDDEELVEFWNVLKEREDLQLMFKQTKNMSPKDIRQIIKIIKAIEDEEDSEN